MAFRNIIFDIGNVIVRFKPDLDLRGHYSETEIDFIRKKIISTPQWQELDLGRITNEEAIRILQARHPDQQKVISSYLTNCYQTFTPITSTVGIIRRLKQSGYNLFLLSNYHKEGYENYLLKNELFQLFNGGVISYQAGLIKPDPAIYRLLLNNYELDPAQCIFIDDLEENIHGAADCGLTGIFLPEAAVLAEKLAAFDVLSA